MSVTNSTTPALSGKVAVIVVLLAAPCLRAQTIRTLKGIRAPSVLASGGIDRNVTLWDVAGVLKKHSVQK